MDIESYFPLLIQYKNFPFQTIVYKPLDIDPEKDFEVLATNYGQETE